MPIRFSIPLPGPLSWVPGRRRRRSAAESGPGAGTRAVGAGLDRATARVDAWGDAALERSRARRVEQGLPADPAPESPRVKSFAEVRAEQQARVERKRAERAARRTGRD